MGGIEVGTVTVMLATGGMEWQPKSRREDSVECITLPCHWLRSWYNDFDPSLSIHIRMHMECVTWKKLLYRVSIPPWNSCPLIWHSLLVLWGFHSSFSLQWIFNGAYFSFLRNKSSFISYFSMRCVLVSIGTILAEILIFQIACNHKNHNWMELLRSIRYQSSSKGSIAAGNNDCVFHCYWNL